MANLPGVGAFTLGADEEGVLSRGTFSCFYLGKPLRASCHYPPVEGLHSLGPEGHNPLFTALTQHAQGSLVTVNAC